MSLATFAHPNLRLQYRKLWSDPWKWDTGTAGIVGPWETAGGNKCGSATFLSYDTEAPNREDKAPACPLRRNWFVRICSRARQSDGTLPAKVYWTGFLSEEERVPMGGQPEDTLAKGAPKSRITAVQWTALGLGGLLANVDLHRVWRGCGTASAGIRSLESLVRFGYERRPDDENRGGKRILYSRRDAGTWSLHDLVVALLDWHLYEPNGSGAKVARFPHWPAFQLGGLTAALEWPVRDVTLGGNLFEALAAILHPRRGLFFTAEAPPNPSASPAENDSSPVTLRIQTFAQTAVTIPLPGGGTQDIPANTAPITLAADVPHRLLRWAPPPSPRRLTLHGHRDVRIISLRWSRTGGTEDGALARRWNTADDSKAGDNHIDYTHVYRTWSIRQEWTGGVKGTTATTLPHRLTTLGSAGTPDAVHGAGGLDGGLTTSGSDLFPEYGIEFLDQIPMPSQATNPSGEVKPISDWLSATATITLDEHSTPLRPMAFVHHRGADTWERLNVEISFPDARTVRLGSGPKDATKIKAKLSLADDDLVITCAIHMPSALAVSYIPDVLPAADVQISADRAHTVSWAERIVVQAGTVFGLVAGAAPTAPTADRTVRDDTGLLRSTLLLQRLTGERSAGGVYTDNAEIDTGIKPGQMITQATVPGPSGTYIALGYLVTSVRCDPADGPQPKTVVQIDTAQIDLEAIA
jgi:hypothetical protein